VRLVFLSVVVSALVVIGGAVALHPSLVSGRAREATTPDADVNQDGRINAIDLLIVARNMGRIVPTGTPTPTATPTLTDGCYTVSGGVLRPCPTNTPTPTPTSTRVPNTPPPTATPCAGQCPPTAFEMLIDCDLGTAGVQSACSYPAGTGEVTVGVVLRNNSGGTSAITAFAWSVLADESVLTPSVVLCDVGGANCNPDFNQQDVPYPLLCGNPLPNPDSDPSPLRASSFLSCITGSPGDPFFVTGQSLLLGTVSYAAHDGSAQLSLSEAAAYDGEFSEMMSCNPSINVPSNCFEADVQVGAP
jgi:hypothetical protein